MSGSRRLLILGGIALAAWGMGYGLWYAGFAEHPALNNIGLSLTTAFEASASRNPGAAETSFGSYQEAKYVYDRQVDVHGHWIGLAMLLIIVGMAFDRLRFAERFKLALASALMSGAVLFPLGVLLETFDHGAIPRGMAILGSALLIAALAGITLGLATRESSTQ